ncbi:MAG TPA: hypothetical protein VFJ50_09210, partial [Gemmatimonadales bacterium]|nr:hypothetical protein [Gemmatimonadales bacterium]
MPPPFAALALSLAVSAPSLLAQTDPVVASRAEYREAVKAYEAHDTLAFLRHASEAARLRPTHGGVLYALASARALAGDSTTALAALRRFATLGYTADVDSDADLASLRGIAAFDTLRAELRRNAEPIARSKPAFTLAERDLLTEGLAYDSVTRTFLV